MEKRGAAPVTLQAGLRDLGWVEGKNMIIDFRWADRVDELPALAAALVRMPVDVIFARHQREKMR